LSQQKFRSENAGKNTHSKVLEILRTTQPTGPVLDIPCGEGTFARTLASDGYDVVAIDIVQRENVTGVDFRQADMNEPLPLADNSVDRITCIEGIEHLERPFDFIRECHRVMTNDGLIILTTPNISSIRSRWRWFLTGFHNKSKYALDETDPNPMHHINMLSLPSLRYLLHTNGFYIERIDTNRIKAINWIYLPLAPFQYLVTKGVNRKAKPQDVNPDLSKQVLQQMMTLPTLLGESIIILARKISSPN
jgi:2-polyprenyl-3-methyl-5-hydroxy-6-metoxy-1,4-benzoquinol methylase